MKSLRFCKGYYSENSSAGIFLFKVNNANIRTICEVCSQLTIKTSERRHWRLSGVYIFNFEQISHISLVFSLLTLNKQMLAGKEGKPANSFLWQKSWLNLINLILEQNLISFKDPIYEHNQTQSESFIPFFLKLFDWTDSVCLFLTGDFCGNRLILRRNS